VPERGRAAVQPAEKTAEPVARERAVPAEKARTNELATPPIDDRFGVARQVAALERAIELFQAFIERAGDDPRYAEAVRRSEGRIADARLTICFLLEKSPSGDFAASPCDGAEGK
jgi:hypothetical protein